MEQGVATIIPAMSVAGILVAFALVALGTVIFVAIRNRKRAIDVEKALESFRSLDIAAFRNLVDANEDAFLRENLSASQFRKIKRQRAWAALLYTREAGKAAAALAQIGQVVQRSQDPAVAASGLKVAENAFRLRLQTVSTSLRLLVEIAIPDLQNRSLPRLFDQYERSAQTLLRVGGAYRGYSG